MTPQRRDRYSKGRHCRSCSQSSAGIFAGDFDKPQRSDVDYIRLRLVFTRSVFQHPQELLLLRVGFHIDEIDDDDAADIAQADLFCDLFRRFQIRT